MNDRNPLSEGANEAAGRAVPPEVLSSAKAARRRLLLKGVGKGGAVVAAALPLKSFATVDESKRLYILPIGSTGKNQCSVSGQHSGFHSGSPETTSQCGGCTIASWCSASRTWPSGCNKSATCKSVFSGCTLTVPTSGSPSSRPATLLEVLSKWPNSDDAHWVCAWLNSCGPSSLGFPYSSANVLKFYGDPATKSAALTFFKNYTEMS